jgi:hypothetical protein
VGYKGRGKPKAHRARRDEVARGAGRPPYANYFFFAVPVDGAAAFADATAFFWFLPAASCFFGFRRFIARWHHRLDFGGQSWSPDYEGFVHLVDYSASVLDTTR